MRNVFLFSIIILFTYSYTLESRHEVITIRERCDGFGAHVLHNIAAFCYAEINNKEFCYRPFNRMEHNYDNDPDFIAKKENLLNFINHFITIEEARKRGYCILPDKYDEYLAFFDKHVASCSKSLEKLKKIFRANKNIDNYFNNNNFNIAVHVRRPNPHDSRIYGTDIPDDHYINIINKLRAKYGACNPLFHIYSQGNSENFIIYHAPDIILHLNESVEDTFTGMVLADVLVTGRSSFSYTAGFLSDGIVYYNSYMHAHLPFWTSVDDLLSEKEKIPYKLVDGLPPIYITDETERIGCTWKNGIVWDQPLIEHFYSLLPSNKSFVAFDIGAQTGCFSLLAKYFPNSQWYSFEPIQEVADELEKNLMLNDIHNVSVYQKAVADFTGNVTLKLPTKNHWGLATIGSYILRFDLIKERNVECIDLDSFVYGNNIQKVDFIKLDTQGSELLILRGAQTMILRDRPVILLAYNETNMKQCNVTTKDLDDFLQKFGYEWKSVGREDILCIPHSPDSKN